MHVHQNTTFIVLVIEGVLIQTAHLTLVCAKFGFGVATEGAEIENL